MATTPFPLSARRGLDSPGCKSRFWRTRRAFDLPRAGRGRGLDAENDAGAGLEPDVRAGISCRCAGRNQGAIPSKAGGCDRASGNRPGRIILRGRRRAALFPGIARGKVR